MDVASSPSLPTVLMVYHDAAMLHRMAHGLDQHGYVVFRYTEPAMAMAALPAIAPDVLIIEAGLYLRLHAPLARAMRSGVLRAKVVGIGRPTDVELAAQIQFDAIQRPPFTADALHRTILRLRSLNRPV